MNVLGVIANCGKERAPEVLQRLRSKADELGLKLVADPATAVLMGIPAEGALPFERMDALVVLGGDGTMLRAVRELQGRDIPVIGVNLGSLGFLTSVTETDLERALDCLVAGNYTTSSRAIAECDVRRGKESLGRHRALNDVVLVSASPRVVDLRMSVNNEEVGHFICDGLVISTPTGSTGHSLSAGGPVLMPTARCFVVSLICPHTLSTRPLVLPDDATIRVTVADESGSPRMTADGQTSQSLAEGDVLEVTRSAQGVRFIHLPGYSYFSVLRHKLHWRGSNV
jgi:NAD+ kinase